jgi:putative tryptophan/tyrosine transport system substrate-binding protein
MRRREFIAVLGSAAAWPVVALAQRQTMPVIGFLHPGSPDDWRDALAAFHRGLGETGYVEGRNVTVEYRWAEDHSERLPALIEELVRRQVAVIATPDNVVAAVAAKMVTQTIPIVFMVGIDPVALGLVASLNRPGGNATGVSLLNTAVIAKRMELLREIVPSAKLVAYLANQTNPLGTLSLKELQSAADVLGLRLLTVHASNEHEVDAAFPFLIRQHADALLVSADPFLLRRRVRIAALAASHQMPAIYAWRDYAVAGGLVSYGTSRIDADRQVGLYTGRILKGEKPADLPVQQVTKLELVMNAKTAKALGLTIPETLLATADEVIQ